MSAALCPEPTGRPLASPPSALLSAHRYRGARFAAIALRNRPLRARTVEATLRKMPGLRSVTIIPATGGVLVQYDPDAITLARLIATMTDAIRDEPTRGGRASVPVAA